MPKPAHMRATFSGTIGNGLEEFAVNVNFTPAVPGTDAELDEEAGVARTAFLTHLAPLYTNRLILTEARIASVDGTGHYLTRDDGSYQVGINSTPQGGSGVTATNGIQALQVALCVTLLTARPGPTGKGRIFLPWPDTIGLGTDFRITEAQATTVATASKAFLNALKNVSESYKPAVVSSKGYASLITGVRVGRVPDTMRSRRGDLLEQPVQLAL